MKRRTKRTGRLAERGEEGVVGAVEGAAAEVNGELHAQAGKVPVMLELHRQGFEDDKVGAGGDNAIEAEPSASEERTVFAGSAFPAAGKNKHEEVDDFAA
jgi:hypothetical protein